MTCHEPIKKILEITRAQWDVPSERAGVRESFKKVLACRTPELGGQVYASDSEEKVFFNTCKSKACPSCGNRGTLLWQREQWSVLPDIPFVGIVLTMPDVFWPILKAHRNLQHDLPALGAAVVKEWAWSRYKVRLCVIVIQHTFGGRLNHNPHLHIMVSAGGLSISKNEWITSLTFDADSIMSLWRFAVSNYFKRALHESLLGPSLAGAQFGRTIKQQSERRWNVHITREMSKKQFLGYAGRYIRRLPISQRRILHVNVDEVVYQSKLTRTNTIAEESSTPALFIAKLSQHVSDRYQHSMRYFGLLAPRTKAHTSAVVFSLLGQHKRLKPERELWADSLRKRFGRDPLLDANGQRMRRVGYQKPA